MDTSEKKIDLVWGCEEIGKVIGRSDRQTKYLLQTGQIPGQKIGGTWVAERGRLERFFTGEAA